MNVPKKVEVSDLHADTFLPHLNSTFSVRLGDSDTLELELIEVSDKSEEAKQKSGIEVELFSLSFKGPLDKIITQDTHQIEHEHMGTFPLFIGPVFQDKKGIYYQAVFNRVQLD